MWENRNIFFRTLTSSLIFIISFSYLGYAQDSKVFSKFNINRISTFIYNDGNADVQLNGNSGFEFPKGSKKACNFQAGFIWGGKVNGKTMVGGTAFRSGLQPGKILPNGLADNPNSDNARVYRVRRDYKTADLSMEAADEGKTVQEIFDQYEKDWKEWPAGDGAPFEDLNNDGIFQFEIDYPGIKGANQTLWFVANDLDSTKSKYFSGSLPMGIEMQVTIWGYKFDGTYRGDALFKKYVLINKSKNEIKEMHLGIWADPDVGDAGDDLAGCDTTLNMVYAFNAKKNDATYGSFPPAFGFGLLQGPIVDGGPNDKAIFNNKVLIGKKNLSMSAFSWILKHSASGDWTEPSLGLNTTTQHIYNFLIGKSKSGLDWQIPQRLGGGITKFPFSGDYVKNTGYLDGVENVIGDRRIMLCVGPFNLPAGGRQEVVFIESAGGATGVSTNLEAINLLKDNISSAKKEYSHEYKYYTNPTEPKVELYNLDKKVILSWGEDLEQIKKIEKDNYSFEFQGYIVHQFKDSSFNKEDAEILDVYDKRDGKFRFANVYYNTNAQIIENRITLIGNDKGIKRQITIEKDLFSSSSLINWRNYYYGVSYFSLRRIGDIDYYLESPILRIKAKPNSSSNGLNNTLKAGDYFFPVRTSGVNDQFNIRIKVIDPLQLGNNNYELKFLKINGVLKLNLRNTTTNKTIFAEEDNFGNEELPIFDGLVLVCDEYNYSRKPLTENDAYRFNTNASIYDVQTFLNEFNKINVFPNPFYGIANHKPIDGSKMITFTHLPQRAVIRIFNISGQLVSVIEKNSSEKTVKWNLSNNDGWLIPGGFYVAQIELQDYGIVKTLKVIIVPSSSIQPYF